MIPASMAGRSPQKTAKRCPSGTPLDVSVMVKLEKEAGASKLDEVSFRDSRSFFLFATTGREKEQLKFVGNGKKGVAGFKKSDFDVLRQLGIVTLVAYWRNPYKKKDTVLAA